jgi:hypothetical protein
MLNEFCFTVNTWSPEELEIDSPLPESDADAVRVLAPV